MSTTVHPPDMCDECLERNEACGLALDHGRLMEEHRALRYLLECTWDRWRHGCPPEGVTPDLLRKMFPQDE